MSFLDGILNSVSGGLFGTLTGVGSGILGNYFAQKDAAQNQRYAKELMQYQYDLQQQGINAQNQYNLPSAQMERLRNAGLNPHLVYGSGSVVGNSSSAASASLGKSASINRSELVRHSIDAALQTQMNVAQVDNLKAQNDNIKEQNNLIRAQVETEKQRKRDLEESANRRAFDLQLDKDTRELTVQAREYARDIAYYQRDYWEAHSDLEDVNRTIRANEKLISDWLAEHYEERAQLQLQMERLGVKSAKASIAQALNAAANYAADGNIKRLTYRMLKMGMNPNDSKTWRLFDSFMEGLFGGENAVKQFGESISDYFNGD